MINKINKLALLTLVGITMISSCTKKSSDTPAANTPSTPGMSAYISGTKWVADTIYCTNHSAGSNSIYVTAWQKSNTSMFAVGMPNSVTPGTYTVDGNLYRLTYNKDVNTYYVASSGTITITGYTNSIISGTFQGTYANFQNSSDKISITNGAFTADVK